MSFNPPSINPTSSSNNNHNPNQSNPNMISMPKLLPDSFFENLTHQLAAIDPTIDSQPPADIFDSFPPVLIFFLFLIDDDGVGLFEENRNDIAKNGTVELMGNNDPSQLPKNNENAAMVALTARIRLPYCSDELRMTDYFHLKNNTLTLHQKLLVKSAIRTNLSKRGCSPDIISNFPPGDLPPNLATLFGISHQNSQPFGKSITCGMNQITPSLLVTNNSSSETRSKNFCVYGREKNFLDATVTQKNLLMKTTTESLKKSLDTKKSAIKTIKPKAKNTGKESGSFNFEFNKMLFVSSLVQTIGKHNMTMPEDLLDNTDFIPKLLEFLKQYDVNLPTENIPRFETNSTHLLTQSRNEEDKKECPLVHIFL